MRHSNVELPSLEEKSKLALSAAVGSVGLESIVVCGAVASKVKVRVEGVSVLPTASRARTRMV